MGLYTIPADNSSKNKTIIKTLGWSGLCNFPADNSSKIKTIIKKPWGSWVFAAFQQTIHLKIKQLLSKSFG